MKTFAEQIHSPFNNIEGCYSALFVSCLVSGPVCTQRGEEIVDMIQECRMLHNEELCDLYMLFSVVGTARLLTAS